MTLVKFSDRTDVFTYKSYNKTKIKRKKTKRILLELANDITYTIISINDVDAVLEELMTNSVVSDTWKNDARDLIRISESISVSMKRIFRILADDINRVSENVEKANATLGAIMSADASALAGISNVMSSLNKLKSGNSLNVSKLVNDELLNKHIENNTKVTSAPIKASPKMRKLVKDYKYGYNKTVKCKNVNDKSLKNDSRLKGYISQGMTDAGDYKIYGFIKKTGSSTTGGAIRIVDKNGNTVKTFTTNDPSVIGHANDLEYDAKTGKVYVATMDKNTPLKSFDLKSAIKSNSNEIKFKDESKLVKDTGLSSASGVTIDQSTGNMYFSLANKIKVVNDGKVVQTILKPTDSSGNRHQSQGIYAKDGNLYVIRYNDSGARTNGGSDVSLNSSTASANMVDIYKDGEYVNTVSVEAPTYKNDAGGTVIGELESITYNDNTGKFDANFYYKTDNYGGTGYSTTEINLT